ncbi:MAG: hypothetical protein AAF288_12875 [Planctomycetota bacterium]
MSLNPDYFKRVARQPKTWAVTGGVTLAAALIVGGAIYLLSLPRFLDGETVLAHARAVPDAPLGNMYESGIPFDVSFRSHIFLKKDAQGWHCVGFTFATAWAIFEEEGHFSKTYVDDILLFQEDWYNATEPSKEKGCVYAMQHYGVGKEIPLAEAQPGDFLQLWRNTTAGHQVVFLDWARNEQGGIVGIRYLGAQGYVTGVEENTEYFEGTGISTATLIPERCYAGRLYTRRHAKN